MIFTSILKLFKNKGIQNLTVKALIKGCFFLFNIYIINNLDVYQIADFAIFYASARFLSFFGVDSMHITFFSKVRNIHLQKKHNKEVVDQIKTHLFVSHLLLLVISFLTFDDTKIIISTNVVALIFSLIRLLTDFSRVDNTIRTSILIEDLFFTFGYILLSIVLLYYGNDIVFSVALAITSCGLLVVGRALFYFKRELNINFFSFSKFNFSILKFWFFNKFTLLRGITVFVLYLCRQFGQYYYGDKMVAETHLLLTFFTVFTLISVSIIGAFQNEIVLEKGAVFNLAVFKKIYKKIMFPIIYFVILFGIAIILFSRQILLIIAPKYEYLQLQFVVTILLVLLYFIVNPIFYFFYMNQRVNNFKRIIIFGYIFLIIIVFSGTMIENYWIWFFAIISPIIFIPVLVSISSLIKLRK